MRQLNDCDDDFEPDDDEADDEADCTCPNCGASVYEDAERCPHCGDYITPVSTSRFGAGSRWIVIVAVLMVVLILVATFITAF